MASKKHSSQGVVELVTDTRVGPCRLIVLPYGEDGVFRVAGSMCAYPDVAAGEDQSLDLVNALLDKGTRYRDQFEVAAILDEIGATRAYHGGVVRTRFSGRALSGAIETLFAVFAEELRAPALDARQVDLLHGRAEARLKQSLQHTAVLAGDALSRHWFDPGHPNYAREVSTDLAIVQDADAETLRTTHAALFGPDEMIVVVVGDVKTRAARRAVKGMFDSWPRARGRPTFVRDGRSTARLAQERIYVHDKPSIDVAIGHRVGIDRLDPDFLPLMIGSFVLGGNFSSRLMQKIRDDMGLTYGIRSGLSGVSVHYDMMWTVNVTLGRDTLDRGVEAVLKQVRKLVSRGITDEELSRAQETMIGSYLVRQDSSARLAQTILTNTERGFPIDQLSAYPRQIGAVTRKQVNQALKKHLRPKAASVVAAGTVADVAA